MNRHYISNHRLRRAEKQYNFNNAVKYEQSRHVKFDLENIRVLNG